MRGGRCCFKSSLVVHSIKCPLVFLVRFTQAGYAFLTICSIQVSDQSLTTFAAHESGNTVAVGTADGSVTILQLSGGLSEMALNEKSAINNMLERETTREKNLEKAMKEAKVGREILLRMSGITYHRGID